ncbi:MAG: DUF5017 domain-containing protein [Hymenobacter sp.]|nr:DUF5017 domain-containing protein [Hymenobacter sp.]
MVNLNDLKVEGKPLYVAFRYVSVTPATMKQRQWNINAFQFRTRFPDGAVYTNAAANADVGFGVVDLAGGNLADGTPSTWTSGTSLQHGGAEIGNAADDDWAVSKPFDLTQRNSDASGGIPLKTVIDVPLTSYQYTYAQPGTYKAVFLAQNANSETVKESIKEVQITVVP